jgi:CHAD domain-containing protein
MRTSVTPASLLVHQADEFLRHWPAVRDGDVAAIHDARVATRRIRELLPLLSAHFTPSEGEHLERVVHQATGRLGRARDVDVMLESLTALETALPEAAADVAAARTRWLRVREKRVRRAIKALERLEVAQTLRDASLAMGAGAPRLSSIRPQHSAARWDDILAAQLRERAGALTASLDRAGGVLFTNRLHAARIAMKKLRYATEISIATGHRDLEPVLRPLRKAQELLGRLHDLDVLAAALRAEGAVRLLPFVDFQRRRVHQRYLSRRAGIIEACAVATRLASRHHRGLTAGRAALVASMPLALLAIPFVRRRTA